MGASFYWVLSFLNHKMKKNSINAKCIVAAVVAVVVIAILLGVVIYYGVLGTQLQGWFYRVMPVTQVQPTSVQMIKSSDSQNGGPVMATPEKGSTYEGYGNDDDNP